MVKVRYGILGTASIARRRFMPALQKSATSEAVAVASRNYDRARQFAEELGIPRAYGGYDELLADPEVEVVYIPLPNHLHAEWTMKAADAGKHVLCEKPMAVDAREAQQIADHCRDRGVLLMEGFMYRHNPRTRLIREMIECGEIGEVRSVIAEFSFMVDGPTNVRLIPGKGAGSLMDVGCYCVNVSRFLFGEEPLEVIAHQHLEPGIKADMTTSAVLVFKDDRTALINCSFETDFRSAIKIAGTRGILSADKFFAPPTEGKISFTIERRGREAQIHQLDAVDQFLMETDHFSECVRTGKQPLLDPHTDAVANARVIDAIRQSAAKGCSIRVQR